MNITYGKLTDDFDNQTRTGKWFDVKMKEPRPMYFVVMTRDNPDAGDKRKSLYPEHRAHLDDQPGGIAIRVSGPLLGENSKPVGSLLIIEAKAIEQVRKYINSDPYIAAGVWAGFSVNEYDWRRGRPNN